jgi:myo-inositol-1(or 4)-monophosphatase
VAADTDEPDTPFRNESVWEARTAAQDGNYLLAFEQTISRSVHVYIASPSIRVGLSGGPVGLVVVTGAGGGSEGEFGSREGGVSGACVRPVLENQHGGLIDRAAPRVAFAAWMALAFAVLGAGAAELPEGDGVAAGFGEEVAAVAEGVGPFAQPGPGRGEPPAPQLPRGGDHRPVVGIAAQGGDVLGGPQRPGREAGTRELTWALDPIDGTANLIHGLPLFAISLALVRDDHPVLGIIDVPALGQRYSAVHGQGANRNGQPIRVSDSDSLADAMVTVGDFAVGEDAARRNELRLAVTAQLARRVLRVRMLGSAAIDLAWLAEGKTDACIILGSHPWDIAAGVIIAAEAGAKIVDLDGSAHTLRAKATIAASPALIADISRLAAEAQDGQGSFL